MRPKPEETQPLLPAEGDDTPMLEPTPVDVTDAQSGYGTIPTDDGKGGDQEEGDVKEKKEKKENVGELVAMMRKLKMDREKEKERERKEELAKEAAKKLRIYYMVPFKEKGVFKKFGGLFDGERKLWYLKEEKEDVEEMELIDEAWERV
jgi:hypothetical protein